MVMHTLFKVPKQLRIFTYLLPFNAAPTGYTTTNSNEIIIRSTPNQTLSIAPTNSTKKQK